MLTVTTLDIQKNALLTQF